MRIADIGIDVRIASQGLHVGDGKSVGNRPLPRAVFTGSRRRV